MVVRRSVAVVLVIIAVVVSVRDHRVAAGQAVVVAAHDLLPGRVLTAADMAVVRAPGDLVPAGAVRLSSDGTGRTVTSTMRAGEIVTDARLLSARLAGQLTGVSDARLVPVRLSDETVADLLREGDVVDVLDESTRVLARDAVVALSAATGSSGLTGTKKSRPVLLAMAAAPAQKVAAVGLQSALTVILH